MGNSIYTLTILHPMIELFLEIKIYEWPKFGVWIMSGGRKGTNRKGIYMDVHLKTKYISYFGHKNRRSSCLISKWSKFFKKTLGEKWWMVLLKSVYVWRRPYCIHYCEGDCGWFGTHWSRKRRNKNNLLKLKTILTLILSFRYEKMARICFLVFKSLSKIGNEHCPKWSQGHSRPI